MSSVDMGAFQSVEWKGFYTYQGRTRRHRMDLVLTFSRGRIEAGEYNATQ